MKRFLFLSILPLVFLLASSQTFNTTNMIKTEIVDSSELYSDYIFSEKQKEIIFFTTANDSAKYKEIMKYCNENYWPGKTSDLDWRLEHGKDFRKLKTWLLAELDNKTYLLYVPLKANKKSILFGDRDYYLVFNKPGIQVK